MSKSDPGFFTMKDAVIVLKQPDLTAAKNYIRKKIKEFTTAHPHTKPENIAKANQMIERAPSIEKLSLSVSNFILAHSSEGLKVLK